MLNEIVHGKLPIGMNFPAPMEVIEVPESEISVEISSEPLYCLCQEPWDYHNRKFMIHCDHCSDWFHGTCVGIDATESKDIEKYHCPKCVTTAGPSVLVDPNARKTGKRIKSIRCTPEFIAKLKEYKFNIPDEVVLKMRGQSLTLPWLVSKGFTRPILVESIEALGMKLPHDDFSVRDVERYVGSERMVDVIDVERQSDNLMSMHEFTEYFTSPNRAKLLNLISLEFSQTNLNKLVDAPAITRKLDWVANYWPDVQRALDQESIPRPQVSKYCLISAKDSYTDFHVDFGGTSVWYHVLWGEKVFYFIEPSEANLNIYKRWMHGEMGNDSFLADEVPVCFRCVLKKGQTLLIPTGWIHAVYTPEDSLVFGGNFLHLLNMDLQLHVYDIEKKLQTPSKYLFPSFEATHWYAAYKLVEDLQATLNTVPAYMIRGLKALVQALKIWLNEKDIGKVRRESIPALNCKKIIHDLSRELKMAEKRFCHSGIVKEGTFGIKEVEPKIKEFSRRESMILENGYSVTSSREGSPTSGSSKEPLKLLISLNSTSNELPCVSPRSNVNDLKIRMKIKKQNSVGHTSGEESHSQSPASSPKGKERRVKIRLSLSGGKAESIDDSNTGSDGLHIVESDRDIHLASDSSEGMLIDLNRHKPHKKHHHKKCKRNKSGKLKHVKDSNRTINDELAGTLDGLEELFESSNYSERISQCENTSQAIKDTVAGMVAMKGTILPKRLSKHKRRNLGTHGETELKSDDESIDGFDGIEKVHQDDDYIYLPLAGSDDESTSGRGRSKKGRRKEEDESWSPRAKVGPVGHRETKSNRFNAKREAVEKGLEKAAATLENQARLKRKMKSSNSSEIFKVKKLKLAPIQEKHPIPSTSSSMDIATRTSILAKKFADSSPAASPSSTKKPKKGLATPKQRLGKILKINKFARF